MTVQEVLANGIEGLNEEQTDVFIRTFRSLIMRDPKSPFLDRAALRTVNALCNRMAVFQTIKRARQTMEKLNQPTSSPAGLEQPGTGQWY